MKTLHAFPRIILVCIASAFLFYACELFAPLDEVDLIGTWDMDKVSVDVDVSGDNLAQVLAFRALVGLVKGELNDEMNDQLDSLGATMTFNTDNTFEIALFDDSGTGTYIFNTDDRLLTLASDSLTLDELNVERLNSRTLNISWVSEKATMDISDTTDSELTVQVIIEAWLSRVE